MRKGPDILSQPKQGFTELFMATKHLTFNNLMASDKYLPPNPKLDVQTTLPSLRTSSQGLDSLSLSTLVDKWLLSVAYIKHQIMVGISTILPTDKGSQLEEDKANKHSFLFIFQPLVHAYKMTHPLLCWLRRPYI